MINRRHFSNDQAIAAASPSIGAYRRSASVQNLLPANTMCHPSGQHTGAFSSGGHHVQCFCNSRKPIPSLLQSGAKQVILFISKVVTPFFTSPTISLFRLLTMLFRDILQPLGCYLVDQPEPGPSICNVFRAWEAGAFSKSLEGVTPVDVKASELDYVLAELEFILVDDHSIRLA